MSPCCGNCLYFKAIELNLLERLELDSWPQVSTKSKSNIYRYFRLPKLPLLDMLILKQYFISFFFFFTKTQNYSPDLFILLKFFPTFCLRAINQKYYVKIYLSFSKIVQNFKIIDWLCLFNRYLSCPSLIFLIFRFICSFFILWNINLLCFLYDNFTYFECFFFILFFYLFSIQFFVLLLKRFIFQKKYDIQCSVLIVVGYSNVWHMVFGY